MYFLSRIQTISASEIFDLSDFRKIFHSPLRSTGNKELENLLNLLSNFQMVQKPDSVEWKWSNRGKFMVKNYCTFFSHGGITSQFTTMNWKMPVPTKIKVFSWLVFNNRVLTSDYLKKRNILLWAGHREAEPRKSHIDCSQECLLLK